MFLNTSAATPVERAVGKKTITFEASPCVSISSRRTASVAGRDLLMGTVNTDWWTVGQKVSIREPSNGI